MLSEILADAEKPVAPSDTALSKIAALANDQMRLERLIKKAEEDLKDLQDQYREISEKHLPDAMTEAGVNSFETSEGYKITVKPFYGASITDENRAPCFSWLEGQGHGAMIKKEVTVALPKGDAETEREVYDVLKECGVGFKTKEAVHPSTLNAFVKEQVEGGQDFPMDLFKVFTGRKAKIMEAK